MSNKKINKKVITNLEELLKNDAPYLVEDGKVNLEKLQGLLKGKITEKEDDRFYFNWAGKDKVFQAIQAPAYSTLVPQKDKSIDWDNTENLMIVGENLETLKLLLKPYFGQVKVIYIDPPYNTGKDFIYKDDFSSPLKDYLERTGQKDGNGNRLTTNTEASGRYHSDWLNFMYPRLFLARNLLKDDGVIFISIDDNEVHHLRMIMDEIFGEDSFVIEFSWRKSDNQANIGNIARVKEYIICYARDRSKLVMNKMKLTERAKKEYRYSDEGGQFRRAILLHKTRGRHKYTITTPSGKTFTGPWMIKREDFIELEKNKGIYWTKGGDEQPYGKIYLQQSEGQISPDWLGIEYGTNQEGSLELEKLIGKRVFDFPKPTNLIKHFITIGSNKSDITLDFFAGSGTTGQAVYELNKEDGGNRKFILVQLDEAVDDTKESGKNAKKLGLDTIADICIERLKRVSQKNKNNLKFKVFKLSPSNFNLKEEFELKENKDLSELKDSYLKQLGLYVDQPVLSTANAIDIVYEIILKNGFSLNSKIDEVKIGSNKFHFVLDKENNLEMYICLDSKIKDTSVEKIRTTEYKGKTFAFYDNALTDSQKINLNTFVKLQVI